MKLLQILAPLAITCLVGACSEPAEVADNLVVLDEGPINPDCELAKNALNGAYEYKNRDKPVKVAGPDTSKLSRCHLSGAGAFLAKRGSEQWYFVPRTDNIFSFDPRLIYSSEGGTERWISMVDSAPAAARQAAELQRLFAASKEVK